MCSEWYLQAILWSPGPTPTGALLAHTCYAAPHCTAAAASCMAHIKLGATGRQPDRGTSAALKKINLPVQGHAAWRQQHPLLRSLEPRCQQAGRFICRRSHLHVRRREGPPGGQPAASQQALSQVSTSWAAEDLQQGLCSVVKSLLSSFLW